MNNDMDTVAIKARWAIVAQRALLGAAFLMMAGQTASADTTMLSCDTGLPLDMGPTTVDLNPAQRTVTLHHPALKADGHPARTVGPLSATFGSNEIDFAWVELNLRHTYVINRSTAVVQVTVVNLNGGQG